MYRKSYPSHTSRTLYFRVSAGLDVAAGFVSMLPEPIGSIGSALLGLVGGFFEASSPTTDEYAKLRNQVGSTVFILATSF